MKIPWSLLVFTIFLTKCVCAFNILGIFPYQGKSHFLVFRVLMRELAKRGHNVTVISYFPQIDLPNYNNIQLPLKENVEGILPIEHYGYVSFYAIGGYLKRKAAESCEDIVSTEAVRDLVNSKAKFDVILTEQFCTDCGLGIAYKLKAPVVGLTSGVIMPWHYPRFGVPYNPAYIPFHFLGGGHNPTLYQRVERTIFHFSLNLLSYFMQKTDESILRRYWDDIPPLEELASKVHMNLVYLNFIYSGSSLYPQNVKEVGGYHVSEAKPLTGELKKFVEEAEHGVIYISFGSMTNSKDLPPTLHEAIHTLFASLPHRFIFKCAVNNLKVDPEKVYVSSWLPQTDILGHPNIKAFIGHGGQGGVTEAMYYAVPMVVMPIFGDQPCNAANVEESGLGIQILFNDVNKDSLLAVLKKVLEPQFKERVKEVSRAWHDRPMSALDTAVYWVEFTARNPNVTITPASAKTPWYQICYLDIAGVLIGTGLFILVVLKGILSLSCGEKKEKNIKLKRK